MDYDAITVGDNKQLRGIRLGSNYLSNNPLKAHFGLGKSTRINRLEVTWPNGSTTVSYNLSVDEEIEIKQQVSKYSSHY